MSRSTRVLLNLGALSAAVTLLAVWWARPPGQAFDQTAWQADSEIGSGARQAMADRLIAQGSLTGLTRAELVDMLGDPPVTDYFFGVGLRVLAGPAAGWLFPHRLGMAGGASLAGWPRSRRQDRQ